MPTVVHVTSDQLKTLAHPLRYRLLGALRSGGASTASALAAALGSNSGKTSYHLRVLAEAGLVNEAHDLGDNRDRWWRAAHDITRYEPGEFLDDPDARAASTYLATQWTQYASEQLARWVATRDEWSDEWIAAADNSDLQIRLTPARLRALNDELLATARRYLDEPDDGPDALPCQLILNGFPNPEPQL